MLRNTLSAIVLLIVFCLPAVSMSQEIPSGKWWHNPKIIKELNLSKKEVRNLDKLYADSRRKLIKLKSAVESEQFELDNLLSSKTMNDAEVRKQFERLEKARKKLADERFKFVVGVREIIGSDRFQQLKRSYKKWQ